MLAAWGQRAAAAGARLASCPTTSTFTHSHLAFGAVAALATLGPVMHPDDVAAGVDVFPFRTLDCPGEPHPGLRAYPFLGQV